MGRDLTPLIIQSTTRDPVTNALNLKTQVAVDIVLPDSTPLHLATANLVISSLNDGGVSEDLAEPVAYQSKLRRIADIVFSRTGAPDTAEFDIEHLSLAWAPYFAAGYGAIDNSDVTIFECFKKPDGTYEADILFIGYVTTVSATTEVVRVPCVGDFSAKTAQVSRPVTQRCYAREFEDDICGHTGAPPGSTCSFIKEDAEGGCRFWRWEAMFSGAPFMSAIDPATGNPIGPSGGRPGSVGGDEGFDEPGRRRIQPLPFNMV